MLFADDETIAAAALSFWAGGTAAAVSELRRRFWLLQPRLLTAASEAVDRLLTWAPHGHPRVLPAAPRRLQ